MISKHVFCGNDAYLADLAVLIDLFLRHVVDWAVSDEQSVIAGIAEALGQLGGLGTSEMAPVIVMIDHTSIICYFYEHT